MSEGDDVTISRAIRGATALALAVGVCLGTSCAQGDVFSSGPTVITPDGGSEIGVGPDAGGDGGPDGGPPSPPPVDLAYPSAGGGTAASSNYGASVSLGAPVPRGRAESENYRIRLAPASP
ncbi:MAG: hypothetical protein ABEL76_06900 [Bradymonadaceae bacterium]